MSVGRTEVVGGFRKTLIRVVGGLGEMVWAQWDELRHAAAVIGTVLYVSVRPSYWVRTERGEFVMQVVAIGVESVGLVCGMAVFVGITVVVQLTFWVEQAGQSQLLGPLLVAVVARELSPVLVSIVVIVRSGSVMATELGIMRTDGRAHTLEAQGISPFLHLVVPRVLAAAVSTFCLTVVFHSGCLRERIPVRSYGGQRQPRSTVACGYRVARGSSPRRARHPQQEHFARPVCRRFLLHRRAGRRRVAGRGSAGCAACARAFHCRIVCDFHRRVILDVSMMMKQRFKFRHVNEITGIFVTG